MSPPAGVSPQPPGRWLHPGPWGKPCLGAPRPSYLVFRASRGDVGVPPPLVYRGVRRLRASHPPALAAGGLLHCRRHRAGRGPSTACLPGGAPSSGLAPPRACGGGSPALPVGPVRGFGGGSPKGLQASFGSKLVSARFRAGSIASIVASNHVCGTRWYGDGPTRVQAQTAAGSTTKAMATAAAAAQRASGAGSVRGRIAGVAVPGVPRMCARRRS